MYYLMEPLDSFFFRGPVPFEVGGETVAVESVFPPLPSVYAGAFRKLNNLGRNAAGQLKVGFNGLYLGEDCLFPMPADLFWSGSMSEGLETLCPMELTERPVSNYPLDFCLVRPGESVQKDKKHRWIFLTAPVLEKYLSGEAMQYEGIDLNDGYLAHTPKIGIETNPISGTAQEHRLYQITEVRPAMNKPLRLIAQISVREGGQEWPQEPDGCPGGTNRINIIKLGGEGKLAAVYKTDRIPLPQALKKDSVYFKLYLATPAIFEKGWLPGWLNRKTGVGSFTHKDRKVTVKLISAQVGRSIPCGGFGHDGDGYHPRELRFAVPAGSVYYFKLLEGSYGDAVKLFHGKCISDYRESMGFIHPNYNKYHYCDRGFGFALVGSLGKEQEEIIHEQ